jgi:hypothetical protein
VIPFVTEPAIGLDDGKSIRDDTKVAWKALADGDIRAPSTRVAARAIATLLFLCMMQFFALALDQKILQLSSQSMRLVPRAQDLKAARSSAYSCIKPGMMRPPLERPVLVHWDFPWGSRIRSGPAWSQGFPFCTQFDAEAACLKQHEALEDKALFSSERSAARLAHQSGGLGVPSSNLGAPTRKPSEINDEI